MRAIIIGISSIFLLSACNTIDGIGEDFGAVGQSFGNVFDDTIKNSRARRDAGAMPMGGGGQPPMMQAGRYNSPQMRGMPTQQNYHNMAAPVASVNSVSMPPQFNNSYGAGTQYSSGFNNNSYGGGYGAGSSSYGGHGGADYVPQPRRPSMPYYYNEGY